MTMRCAARLTIAPSAANPASASVSLRTCAATSLTDLARVQPREISGKFNDPGVS